MLQNKLSIMPYSMWVASPHRVTRFRG